MGGTTFEHYVDGTDVDNAFRRAREEAGYDHGHGGYSGTIVEKPGFTVITRAPLSRAEADALANKLINDDDDRISDKWGNAGAIPITPDDSALVTKTVRVQTGPFPYDWQARDKELRTAVGTRLKIDPDNILSITMVKDTPASPRVRAEAPKGQTETRYTITNSQYANWSSGLPSQAEARAKASELAGMEHYRHSNSDAFTYEIEAVTRRVDGAPLVRVTRTVPKHELEVMVTYRKPGAPRGTNISGWLFFGWASC